MSRFLTALFVATLALTALPHAANAQAWPTKPIRIIVPFAPGGAIDVMARLLAAKMQEALNSTVIVENKAGVGGNLGADYVAKQPADGYTILYNTNGQAISPATFKHLPFDPINDFIAVTQLFSSNLLLAAGPRVPAKTFQEFVALAKLKPGILNYGSSGIGNPLHLTMELLKLRAGLDIQMVPFRSDGEIINAMLAGDVDAAVVPVITGKEQVMTGALHGLGVTSARRAKGFDVPTIAEQGLPDFDSGGWQGLFVAAKTPDDIVKRIQVVAKAAFATPDMQARVDGFALSNVFSTPEQFGAFYRSEIDNFKRIVREAKIPMQE